MSDTNPPVHIQLVPTEGWDELVCTFPGYTIFHSSAWLSAVAEAHGVDMVLAVATADGEPVAVWPLLEQRLGPFRVLASPRPGWSTVYLGPLFRDDANPTELVSAFLRHPRLRRATYMYSKVCDEHRDIDLSACGFELQHRYRTYIVDLDRDEDEIWDGLERRCRKMIRKGRRQGLEVVRENGTDYVEDFWQMSLEVFARSRIKPTYSRKLLDLVVERLTARGALLAMSVMFEGRRVSTQLLPFDQRGTYAWAAAGFSEYRKMSLTNILDWESILEAKRLGLSRYDLISVYGGPGYYKRSFGPQEVITATHWERFSSPWARVGKRMYAAWLRRQQRTRVSTVMPPERNG